MNIAPILSKDDFKNLHNGLCEIRGVIQTLEGLLSTDLVARLKRGMANVDKGLADAYALEEAVSERRSAHYSKVADDHDFNTIWSNDDVDDLYMPHPFEGVTHILYSEHWGNSDVTVPIKGNTWVDLWRAAETAINESGDNHHIFIEDFRIADFRPEFLLLSTGS